MLFNSLGFVLFLLAILTLYYTPLFTWKGRKIMLLAGSYLFYGLWNPPLILLLWISTMVDWIAGNRLYREQRPGHRKKWLLLSMVINLGFLGFFKYGNFLMENFTILVQTIGWNYTPPKWDILLPMGISFYTFQTMSYTIDLYRQKNTPARSFLDFALYVTFFPQLVAGPIVRASDLVTQFYEEKKATISQFVWGLFLLTLGLFQKIVLADTLLADTSDAIFQASKSLHFFDTWAGVLAFSGQIFFDFAGYSTCAIGIAMMLGFHLPDNFRYPYGSLGFSDFWNRWHISLSSWLRDYLYIPLGGNRHGLIRMYIALMTTMLLGGLWHGAAWTFVAWGALHGAYLVIEKLLKRIVYFKFNAWTGLLMAGFTFTCVNVTWVFFRADSFRQAGRMLWTMSGLSPGGEKILGHFDLIKVFTLSGLLFLTHWLMRDTSVLKVSQKINPVAFGIAWASLLFLIIISQGHGEQFIYFQF